jgi:LmbE family N-acetylglucosaminyl deacetylase
MKLYHLAARQAVLDLYEEAFGELVMTIDGRERRSVAWPEWMIAADIDARDYWRTVWAAVQCHETQIRGLTKLATLPEDFHTRLWAEQTYGRVFSLVNGGRHTERDLFEGLR